MRKVFEIGIIVFAIVFALFMLIYAGWQWMTSSGDKQKLQQVRQRIAYILVGLVVVFASFLVISLIGNFFGTNLLNLR
jgi:multisubunit Na+/H+ antiporter MnhB subunit